MKVIIAEKPDQGSTLASPFKSKKYQGYIEIYPNEIFPNGAYVTWAIGHLCQLVAPEKYKPEWKRWSVQNLPIIPDRFQYEVEKSKYKQYQVVKTLLTKKEVTEIIHAGDAGREGELIVRNIINHSGVKKPMKRLWISSLTKKAITEGFEKLLQEQDTRSLFYEAYTRACADWVIGMNASRIYSLLLKQKGIEDVFSAGRVQTPTLALIVKRELEIEQFKAEPFWEVLATFNMNGKKYEGKWHKDNESRINEEALAKKIAAFCEKKTARVEEMETERKEYQPPLLFNLSSLQATANKRYKLSPKKTLDVLQQLYQKGIVSYPRSDSSFITPGEAESFPEILGKISRLEGYKDFFPLPIESIKDNKRYVNEKKVTDHYAIIPTEQVVDPSKLSGDEQKIYDLVIRQLLAAHHDKAIFDYTTITTLVDERAQFISKGKQQIQEGWRKVILQDDQDKETILPIVEKNEEGKVSNVKVKEGKTQAPKRYTEGQLITLMKTAGKHLEDSQLEKVLMKTEGLGTEATRAGIITMLKDRKYIDVKKNQVFATDKGKVLIRAIGDKILASPEMTAKWEQRLSEIGTGKASPAVFMEQIKKLSEKIIQDAIENSKSWNFEGLKVESIQRKKSTKTYSTETVGKCKLCDGQVVDKGTFYGCSNYSKSKCTFTLSKQILGKKISTIQITKLLETGQTDVIKGFKRDNKQFDAALKLTEDNFKVSFIMNEQLLVEQP